MGADKNNRINKSEKYNENDIFSPTNASGDLNAHIAAIEKEKDENNKQDMYEEESFNMEDDEITDAFGMVGLNERKKRKKRKLKKKKKEPYNAKVRTLEQIYDSNSNNTNNAEKSKMVSKLNMFVINETVINLLN